jgi:hypothetical protein
MLLPFRQPVLLGKLTSGEIDEHRGTATVNLQGLSQFRATVATAVSESKIANHSRGAIATVNGLSAERAGFHQTI